MRRRPESDSLYWHCRYTGTEEKSNFPVTVRKTIDAILHSTNMMEFLKHLGLRF